MRRAERQLRPRARKGVSLIEALVALVVAGMLLATLVQAMGGASRLSRAAQTHHDAQALARALLDDPAPLSEAGRAGALEWRRTVGPSPHDPLGGAVGGLRLMRIAVEIDAPGLGRPLRLATERVLP